MNVGEIIKDSIKYPFSNWKKILILGIIWTIGSVSFITRANALISTKNITLTLLLGLIGFIFALLVKGYSLRIIKSSLNGMSEPPEFNSWVRIFTDGIKVLITAFVYSIPAILIILVLAALSFASNPSTVADTLLRGGIWILLGGTGIWALIAWAGVWFFIAILYEIIIAPILFMGIANMAKHDNELGAAFRFREILNKIRNIGWTNLITWYLLTGIMFLILIAIWIIILGLFIVLIWPILGIVTRHILEQVLLSLIVYPYLIMYFYRSVALIYQSE